MKFLTEIFSRLGLGDDGRDAGPSTIPMGVIPRPILYEEGPSSEEINKRIDMALQLPPTTMRQTMLKLLDALTPWR